MENFNSSFRRLIRNLRNKRTHEKTILIRNAPLLSQKKESEKGKIPSTDDDNNRGERNGQILPNQEHI